MKFKLKVHTAGVNDAFYICFFFRLLSARLRAALKAIVVDDKQMAMLNLPRRSTKRIHGAWCRKTSLFKGVVGKIDRLSLDRVVILNYLMESAATCEVFCRSVSWQSPWISRMTSAYLNSLSSSKVLEQCIGPTFFIERNLRAYSGQRCVIWQQCFKMKLTILT
jgi:hypothetical protein